VIGGNELDVAERLQTPPYVAEQPRRSLVSTGASFAPHVERDRDLVRRLRPSTRLCEPRPGRALGWR